MENNELLAKHMHQVYFGGNWCDVNLKDLLSDVSFEEAKKEVLGLNSILSLCFHLNYYITGLNHVFKGGELEIKDKFSFDHSIKNAKDWDDLVQKSLKGATEFSEQVKLMSREKMNDSFVQKEYGSYATNILGILEHCHYHLGQIVLLKKILRKN